MSLAAAAASQHLQEPGDPMISERKPQTAAAIPQHMQEPVDPMVRERKPQSRAAATPQHMQEAPVDLMIRERTMYFKGQSPLVAECPVVKKVATKAADAPHITSKIHCPRPKSKPKTCDSLQLEIPELKINWNI